MTEAGKVLLPEHQATISEQVERTGEASETPVPHLLHVIPSYAPGGVPLRITSLFNYFGSRYRHTLISTTGDIGCRAQLNGDVRIDFPEVDVRSKGLLSRTSEYRRFIKGLQPDLLLTYQWGSMEWALANRFSPLCPHIHLESGFGPEEADRQLRRRVWMRRLALGNIRQLIVPSQTLVKIAREQWRVPPEKINYVPNGVDCDRYSSTIDPAILPDFKSDSGDVVIGTMTPLRAEKNLPRLIRAFASLNNDMGLTNTRLLVLGEGRERPVLEKMVQELGLSGRVHMPGHVANPEKILGLIDIYALSSDTEQMPNAVIQAMAACRPVVGLDVGDVRHIVSAENKPLIAPGGDDAAFTQALARLVQDPELRDRVARSNLHHVRSEYNFDRMIKAYDAAWSIHD